MVLQFWEPEVWNGSFGADNEGDDASVGSRERLPFPASTGCLHSLAPDYIIPNSLPLFLGTYIFLLFFFTDQDPWNYTGLS